MAKECPKCVGPMTSLNGDGSWYPTGAGVGRWYWKVMILWHCYNCGQNFTEVVGSADTKTLQPEVYYR